jgi:hypothetical protein
LLRAPAAPSGAQGACARSADVAASAAGAAGHQARVQDVSSAEKIIGWDGFVGAF